MPNLGDPSAPFRIKEYGPLIWHHGGARSSNCVPRFLTGRDRRVST